MWSEDYTNRGGGTDHPEEELAAFALNALDRAEFQAVLHHVIECPHCQEVLLGFEETAAQLTQAVPETPLPGGLKGRTLAAAVGRTSEPRLATGIDTRWSTRRLRRWLAPATMGVMGLLLLVSVGVMAVQQRTIDRMAAAGDFASSQEVASAALPAASRETARAVQIAAPPASDAPLAVPDAGTPPAFEARRLGQDAAPLISASYPAGWDGGDADSNGRKIYVSPASAIFANEPAANAEEMYQMKQEMAEVVEATVLSAQPESEKMPMKSPMGIETDAKGVLVVEPSGRHGVLMVSGMPADSYQIWLVRHDKRMLIDRIVVNDDDGSGVKQLELPESVFEFSELALLPDDRHGPTNPAGDTILTARIISGPPMPPAIWRGR